LTHHRYLCQYLLLFITAMKIQLPSYFPVVPKGCEVKADLLFKCIAGDATDNLRLWEEEQITSHEEIARDPVSECCQTYVQQYKSCCDKQLKKRSNWMLTESFRVQDEYRYAGKK
jgi:hypothetical protein